MEMTDAKFIEERNILLELNRELTAWNGLLGEDAWAEAHEECHRLGRRGRQGQAVLAYMVETKGTDRIKEVWRQLQSMTASPEEMKATYEEMMASKGAAPAGLGV